jgi:hypothetical protein
MNKFIYKYKLNIEPTVHLELPSGYEILSIQEQNNEICLWALVEPFPIKPIIIETFYLVGTGQMFPWEKVEVEFIDTVLLNDDSLVIHVFKQK